jgi:hypothetical protein
MAVPAHIKRRIVTGGVFAACCFSFFQFILPYHLFFKEQMQLFLLTGEYFLDYAGKPAWLACYAGDFLTQFFYLRGGGALTLTLVLCLEYSLWVRALRHLGLKRYAAFSALLPVVADGFLHCGLYYELPASVSIILVLAAFEAFILIKRTTAAFVAGIALLPVLYTVAGASFFLFPVLAYIYMWKKGVRGRLYLVSMAAMALSAGIYPATLRSHYLLTPAQAYRYPFPASLNIRGADLDREKILSLSVEAARGRWDVVSRRAQTAPDNPIVTYYANIASSKQGRLPDELLNYYQPFTGGLFLPVNPQSDRLTIFFSNEVFYHLGDMNMAQHSAMLGMIFSPRHRSSSLVKRLAEISSINGDTAVAGKYIRMLDATLFHRRWAKRFKQTAPAHMPSSTGDILRSASDHVASLEWLTANNPDNSYAPDYLLCYHLLNKDIGAFASVYDRYRKGKDGAEHIPRVYGEALLIILAAGKAPADELQSYGISSESVSAFIEYTGIYERSKGDPDMLRERFGRSYWFYYHFARAGKEGEV